MIQPLPTLLRRRLGPPRPTVAPDGARPGADERVDRARLVDRTIITFTIAGWGLMVTVLGFGLGNAAMQRAVADLGSTVLDLLAALMILRAVGKIDAPRIRRGWTVVAAAVLVYAAGDLAWAWLDLVGNTPSPSIADVAYVAYYPIIVAALFMFQRASSARRDNLRLTIDSLIVVLGGGIVVWHTLFRPILATLVPDPVSAGLALGYPIGDLVLLFGVAATALRHPPEIDGRALFALVGGLGLMFVADVGYGQLNLAGTYGFERWPDIVYLSSTLMMALAGYFQAHPHEADDRGATTLSRWLLALPYVALVAGYSVLITLALGQVTGELVEVLYGAVALTAVVLFRQELVLRENSRLIAEQARRQSEDRFRALSSNTSDAVVLVDGDGVVADVPPHVARILGLDAAQLIGRSISRLAHADDVARMQAFIADTAAGRSVGAPLEWRVWDRAGVWRQVETVAANLLDDPSVGRIVLTTRDVQERKTLERQLAQVSLHDLLTDLPNRALFRDRIGQALASAADAGRHTTVLSIGMDGFKRVNDSLGHPVGDKVLQEVARRLRDTVGTADTCGRLGGDEFGVLLDGDSTVEDGFAVAARIQAAIRQSVSIDGMPGHLTASLGLVTSAPGEIEAHAVLRRADTARAVARNAGGDRVVVFAPEMQEVAQARLELELDLRRAVDQGEFVLCYQPIVEIATGELVGAEALVRWDHPTLGRLAPGMFIPLAEESGLIDEIGTWVLETACVEAASWARLAPGRVPRVSINLSAHQLADPHFAWTVQAAMAHASAAPGWITLELTESMLMRNSAASLEQLHAIRALGVQLAIDDFGTGYSSLAYLEQFPITYLKIDRSFVTPLDDPTRGAGIVHAIVDIAGALNLITVAEGVETAGQLARLRELGCPLAQGYLLSRPLEAAAMADLVARRGGPAFAREVAPPRAGRSGRRPTFTAAASAAVPRSARTRRRRGGEAAALPPSDTGERV